MNNITRIIDIVGITVSILIIIIVSDSKPFCQLHKSKDSEMNDSPNDQKAQNTEEVLNNEEDVYYFGESSDDGEYGFDHDDYYDKSIWENSVKFSDSDDSTDNERDEFTLDDFCNKWQRQPCTSMEICEYEDDERRVGLRSEPLNKQEPSFQSEDSKSSDDNNNDTLWKQFNLANTTKQFDEYYYDWKWDDY